ncbi:hypothetical protein ACS0TY_019951 [Phlomoides rotata]
MRGVTREYGETLFVLGGHRTFVLLSIVFAILWLKKNKVRETRSRIRFSILDRIPSQSRQMNELVGISDEVCKNNLRMDRNSFQQLCYLLHDIGGLRNSRYVKLQEKVAVFLSILAHLSKNRSLKYQFKRSGQTVSKHFHSVLRSILKLHSLILSEPQPVPEDIIDTRWGCFKVNKSSGTLYNL